MPNKVKIYKNSARNEDNQTSTIRQYVPQYQIMGIEPEEMKSTTVPGNVLIARIPSKYHEDNPRLRRPSIRQPYADIVTNPDVGSVPNVGNSMEHTWAGVDQDIIDDISCDNVILEDGQFIDNNDIVEPLQNINDSKQEDHSFLTKEELQVILKQEMPSNLSSLEDESYILMVNGVIISISSKDDIEEQTSSFVFGEHELCDGHPVPIENIIVLKKVKIKTGLFLE